MVLVEVNEMEENLMVKMKEEHQPCKMNSDNISNLPDNVLHHIMESLKTEESVRTCVLSKRWKNLWKRLTTLSFNSRSYTSIVSFNNFVSSILSSRDDSISLRSLDISFLNSFNDMLFSSPDYISCRPIDINLLNRVMEYAVFHNCNHLSIEIDLYCDGFDVEYCPSIFTCLSLTYLKLYVGPCCPIWKLPRSVRLSAVTTLFLGGVHFTESSHGNEYAEPFSTCYALNTLALTNCYLDEGVKVLWLFNINLSTLIIHQKFGMDSYNIELTTPNLCCLIINDLPCCHRLLCTCNLSFLEEVNIDAFSFSGQQLFDEDNFEVVFKIIMYSVVIQNWLQLFAYTKKLTISLHTLKFISSVVSNPNSMEIELPCFDRLELLEVKVSFSCEVSDKEVLKLTQILLQNTPRETVDVKVLQGRCMYSKVLLPFYAS